MIATSDNLLELSLIPCLNKCTMYFVWAILILLLSATHIHLHVVYNHLHSERHQSLLHSACSSASTCTYHTHVNSFSCLMFISICINTFYKNHYVKQSFFIWRIFHFKFIFYICFCISYEDEKGIKNWHISSWVN